ncbi:MAG: hypothetical protein V3T17_07475 [Pseudomonadales bacterium]
MSMAPGGLFSVIFGHCGCIWIPWGSVDDSSDLVSSFSNSATLVDLLALGGSITAAYPGPFVATASGTSMAAPRDWRLRLA